MNIPRFTLASLILLLLLLGGRVAIPVQGQAGGSVGLVVRYPDGTGETACVAVPADGMTGLEVLQRAGLPLRLDVQGGGVTICAIRGQGCTDPTQPCFCQCQGSDCRYWTYYHWLGGRWVASNVGAGSFTARPGTIEGWGWGSPPPAPSGAALCATSVAPTAPPARLTATRPPAAPPTTPPARPTATRSPRPPASPTRPPPPSATARPRQVATALPVVPTVPPVVATRPPLEASTTVVPPSPILPNATPILPTATSILPTATPPLPSNTPLPPTATLLPPTATPLPSSTSLPPTVTPQPLPSPTPNPQPPTGDMITFGLIVGVLLATLGWLRWRKGLSEEDH